MSIQAVGWVLEHSDTRLGDRLVLLAIANHAGTSPVDGAWEAWPGVALIAREARLAPRVVQASLARLEEAGVIQRVINGAPDNRCRGGRRPNLYRIITGDTDDRWGVAPLHPTDSPADDTPSSGGVQASDTPHTPGVKPDDTPGVSLADTEGCRQTTPKPSVEPSVEPPPQPPQSQHEPELDPSGGSTIDQQPAHPPALTGDERRQRIHEAVTVIATRLAKSAVGVAKPSAWIGAVAERLAHEHATAGQRLLAEDPDLTPVALADLLENPPDREAAAQRARQRQAEEDTRRRIRETLVQPGNRHRSPEDIARLREQLRLPRRDTA